MVHHLPISPYISLYLPISPYISLYLPISPYISQVVDALRICYTDFKPLRVAGDLIFKVIGEGFERRAKT